METRIFRGVPLRMKQDGWWLDAPKTTGQGKQMRRKHDGMKAGLLITLIATGDLLVWQAVPAISFALLALVIVMAGLALAWPRLGMQARVGIASGAVLSVLPLIELVQPLSVLIALCGLTGCVVALAGLSRGDFLRGGLRLWWVAPLHSAQSGIKTAGQLGNARPGPFDVRAFVMAWALPLGTTVIFALLLIGANPVLDRIFANLAEWQAPAPNMWRLWFWIALAVMIWPVLAAWGMRERLRARRPVRSTVRRQGIINAESVARSLVAFNALFAVQTGMDILFLYGDAGLPDGITAATYAHRGAYPLLVTALLAGLFAVLARPHLAGRPVLRWLMLLWLAQTLALVAASVWRLDTYVDIYGLTRLRLAAYVWMGLVASGLCIVVWQVWRDYPAAWMLLRGGALAAAVLYVCAFVSFDAAIARHNLSRHTDPDTFALCGLSEDVVPAMTARFGANWSAECVSSYRVPRVFQPNDWREWGFRNWRVRRSLANMTQTATAP
ncbi:MAG: DUF4173 domain-containing protein [Tateyamaria sp.]|uniref:DUF4153 domain-containing protein n=1 Tax=Tateyamaria sp. TaxID=1929288 RepID=UPI0032902130